MRHRKLVLGIGLVLLVASSVLLGYAVSELAEGWREVPDHWWSTFAVLGVVGSFGMVVTALVRNAARTRRARSAPTR